MVYGHEVLQDVFQPLEGIELKFFADAFFVYTEDFFSNQLQRTINSKRQNSQLDIVVIRLDYEARLQLSIINFVSGH